MDGDHAGHGRAAAARTACERARHRAGGARAGATRTSAAPGSASPARPPRSGGTSSGRRVTAARRRPALRQHGSSRSRFADVRLVPGSLPAEHVGVDDDEASHASSRQTPRLRSRLAPSEARARSSPAGPSSSRRARPPRSRGDRARRADRRAPPRPRRPPRSRRRDDVTTGVPHAIASSTGSPKPSRATDRRGSERPDRARPAQSSGARRPTRTSRRPTPRADNAQLDAGKRRRLDDPAQILARLERRHGKDEIAVGRGPPG